MNKHLHFNSSGFFLICLGIILLLNTTGVLGWNIWLNLLTLAIPFVLLNIGVSILVKDELWREVVQAGLIVFFLGVGLLNYFTNPIITNQSLHSTSDSVAREDQIFVLKNVNFDLSFASTTITENAPKSDLATSNSELLPRTKAVWTLTNNSDDLNFELERGNPSEFWSFGQGGGRGESTVIDINSKLTAGLLNIDSSFGEINGAFKQAKFTIVEIDNSFGDVKLTFDAQTAPATLDIDNSFGNVEINIPDDIQVIANNNSSFGEISVFGDKGDDLRPVPGPNAKVITINTQNSFGNVRIY
jgi:hypothetical protein